MATTEERTFFLAGEIHALISFAMAVIKTHPDKNALRETFEVASQAGLASLEMARTSDKTIDGFQDVAAKLRRLLEKSAEAG